MNYESIILELLSRIKNLENRCDAMESKIEELKAQREDELNGQSPYSPNTNQRQKMTKEMIDTCYECGKAVFSENAIEFNQEIDKLSRETGVNRNSAIMYVYAVKNMLNGEIYKRAISIQATEKYLTYILKDFGKNGLRKAVQAVKAHIEYRKNFGHTVDGLERIYNEYKMKL